ncbi:hypothetical protein LGQ02_12935 [Bacillus shivajii]|uniref:hypothetical protein n=1 Tax=Bacillus shivajii TaxID=1983719 RepID=UPI001CFB219B|nr:hypothetical protein [Bacillus shivajii]UCZ51766.1 hypothetical protein LGQ02_12935 [Bacillus shivajii]
MMKKKTMKVLSITGIVTFGLMAGGSQIYALGGLSTDTNLELEGKTELNLKENSVNVEADQSVEANSKLDVELSNQENETSDSDHSVEKEVEAEKETKAESSSTTEKTTNGNAESRTDAGSEVSFTSESSTNKNTEPKNNTNAEVDLETSMHAENKVAKETLKTCIKEVTSTSSIVEELDLNGGIFSQLTINIDDLAAQLQSKIEADSNINVGKETELKNKLVKCINELEENNNVEAEVEADVSTETDIEGNTASNTFSFYTFITFIKNLFN